MMMIVVGIPTCIGMVEFLLNYKFCRVKDEEANAYIGGMTICEGLSYVLTCGKSARTNKYILDDYIIKMQEQIDRDNIL